MKEIPRMSSFGRVRLVCTMVITVSLCHSAEAGLVSFWAAEGNPNDSVGPNHGTAVGTVNYSTGEVGQAFDLATTGYINIPNPVAGGLESVTGFTVTAWIYRNGVGSIWGTAPVANLRTTANSSGFSIEEVYTLSNTMGFLVNTTGGTTGYATHGVTAAGWDFGEFHHIAATFDAATHTLVLYRDGEVVASRNDLPGTVMIANSASAFEIGRNIVNQSRWNGRIDEVRFYNTALSQSEIQMAMVIPVNDNPAFTGLATEFEIVEGATLPVPLTLTDPNWPWQDANGYPRDTLTVTVEAGPGEIVNGEYRYTPSYDVATRAQTPVEQEVTLRVSDNRGGGSTASFIVRVSDTNRPPTATALSVSGGAARFTVDTLTPDYVFSDPDDDQEGATVVQWFVRNPGEDSDSEYLEPLLPGNIVPADATVRGQEWFFSVTPRDDRGDNGAVVSSLRTVIRNSAPLVVVVTPQTTPEDMPLDIPVTVTDADGDTTLTLTAEPAQNGNVAVLPVAERTPGEFIVRYTPVADYYSLPGMPDTFTLRACDEGDCSDDVVVVVDVTPVNDPPTLKVTGLVRAQAPDGTAVVGLNIDPGEVLQVSDIDNDPQTEVNYELITLPGNGRVMDNDGTELSVAGTLLAFSRFPLTYEADPAATGVELLELEAVDADGARSGIAQVFIGLLRDHAEITFAAGWNLFSVPLVPDSPEPGAALVTTKRSGPVYCGHVWIWDAATRCYRKVQLLEPGHGYWAFCVEADKVSIAGTPAATGTVQFQKGWNLVGASGYGMACDLAGAGVLVKQVFGWQASPGVYQRPVNSTLARGAGYWLLVPLEQDVGLILTPP